MLVIILKILKAIVANKRICSSPYNVCNCLHPWIFYSQIVALAALDDHIG